MALKKPPALFATDASLKTKVEDARLAMRAKALNGDLGEVQAKRRRKDDIEGLRVRLVSDASKRGTCAVHRQNGVFISLAGMNRGYLYSVRFDGGGAVPNLNASVGAGDNEFFRDQLQLLCAACGVQDSKSKCGKCQREPYCSVDCQRAAWSKHKLVCAPAAQ